MKMISRRDFLKASAVVGATAAMTACGGSSSTSTAASSVASSTAASAAATNGSANIGVCIYQFADNFMTLYRSDLEEYLKDMGYSVTIMDGKNDQNTQTEQINTFLQQGVDVLVINPVQTTSAQTIVDTVKPSETPIVFINREPDKSVLDSYADKCCYVGADARQSGTYQGELILACSLECRKNWQQPYSVSKMTRRCLTRSCSTWLLTMWKSSACWKKTIGWNG